MLCLNRISKINTRLVMEHSNHCAPALLTRAVLWQIQIQPSRVLILYLPLIPKILLVVTCTPNREVWEADGYGRGHHFRPALVTALSGIMCL